MALLVGGLRRWVTPHDLLEWRGLVNLFDLSLIALRLSKLLVFQNIRLQHSHTFLPCRQVLYALLLFTIRHSLSFIIEIQVSVVALPNMILAFNAAG